MKQFHTKTLICLLPLLVIVVIVRIVDPYCLFTDVNRFDEEKYKVGYGYDQGRRYKIFTYWNNPQAKIILGASEINVLNENNIPEEGWHSLSYGGAPLEESLLIYKEVVKDHPLKKVIIAPEFIKYYLSLSTDYSNGFYANFKWSASQSARSLEIYNNKLLYFTDKYVLRSTIDIIGGLFGATGTRGTPKGDKEAFWSDQLDYAEKVYKEDVFHSPKHAKLIELLSEIKEDAEARKIAIEIVVPTQHIDLLKLEFQKETFETYKAYIQTFVDIFDSVHYLAYIEDVSEDKEFFLDPFHLVKPDLYIEKLFKNGDHIILDNSNTQIILNEIRNVVNAYE